MARVLVLTQVLPYPLDSGAKIRAYYVLRHLAQQHEVTLVSFVRAEDHPEAVAHLSRYCRQIECVPMKRSLWRTAWAGLRALLTGRSAVIVRDATPEMARRLRLLEGPFDIVHADQTSMAQHALAAQQLQTQRGHRRPQTVLDAHNALYRILEQTAAEEPSVLRRALVRREARAMRRYELGLVGAFDALVCVSPVDREALAAPAAPVIPICVDLEDRPLVPLAEQQDLILHLGTMFWPPNVRGVLWFAREVLPLVRERLPRAPLAIIGRRPPEEVRALSGRAGVEVLGYVEDPTPYLARTAAFVVPLDSGAGMRVKIVDAWGWGVPIVSTALGAEGIDVRDGEDILIADSAPAFADAVVRLLSDASLRQSLRGAGQRAVAERYDWHAVYRQWDRVYGALLRRAAAE